VKRILLLVMAAAACGGEPAERPAPAAPQPPAAADTVPGPVLTEQGLAPIRVGITLDQAIAALDGYLTIDGPLDGEGSEVCRYGRGDRFPGHIMFEGNRVVRVDADSTVATAAGVRIGTTEAEALRRYPGARVERHHYVEGGHYLVVIPGAPADTLHRLVLETDGERVTARRGGAAPQVEYVEGCA
jgi:hypothetical protein